MLCRCKYRTSFILILIISTPDVSCKHFISHGLSVKPLVLLQLYLQCLTLEMSFRRNLTLQRRSPMKLLLLFGFWALLSSSGFVYLRIFLSISKQVLYICKNVNLENIFKAETFPSCKGLQKSLPSSCYPHMHTLVVADKSQGATGQTWSQQPPLGPSLARGLSSCPATVLGSFVSVLALRLLDIYDRFEELTFVWHYRNGEENQKLPLCFSCISKTPSVFRFFFFPPFLRTEDNSLEIVVFQCYVLGCVSGTFRLKPASMSFISMDVKGPYKSQEDQKVCFVTF